MREQNEITALAYEMSENPTNMKSLFDIILSDPGHVRKQSEILDRHLLEFHNFPAEGSAMKKATDEIMNLLENSTFKKTLHKPKFILDAKDWIRFLRVEFLSGTNHSNFNYKNGYHKFPAYYAEIVENIINGEPVFKH